MCNFFFFKNHKCVPPVRWLNKGEKKINFVAIDVSKTAFPPQTLDTHGCREPWASKCTRHEGKLRLPPRRDGAPPSFPSTRNTAPLPPHDLSALDKFTGDPGGDSGRLVSPQNHRRHGSDAFSSPHDPPHQGPGPGRCPGKKGCGRPRRSPRAPPGPSPSSREAGAAPQRGRRRRWQPRLRALDGARRPARAAGAAAPRGPARRRPPGRPGTRSASRRCGCSGRSPCWRGAADTLAAAAALRSANGQQTARPAPRGPRQRRVIAARARGRADGPGDGGSAGLPSGSAAAAFYHGAAARRGRWGGGAADAPPHMPSPGARPPSHRPLAGRASGKLRGGGSRSPRRLAAPTAGPPAPKEPPRRPRA